MWIGSRVRTKRPSLGVSRQELCRLLDIGWNDLTAFEAGAKHINANLLFRVATSLDVRPDYFFQGYVEEIESDVAPSFRCAVQDTMET
jgi:transcriptional regulator with XRE-family HTH domain